MKKTIKCYKCGTESERTKNSIHSGSEYHYFSMYYCPKCKKEFCPHCSDEENEER